MNKILEEVRAFAVAAHGNQMRRYANDPYIVHPVRVMQTCRQYTDDYALLAAALLHDVLEDTPVTVGELTRFLSGTFDTGTGMRTLALVVELTDVFTKRSHPRINRRKRKEMEAERLSQVSSDAQTIKYADIIDNSGDVTLHEPDFASGYLQECVQLLAVMTKGNAALRTIALHKVNACLRMLRPDKEPGSREYGSTIPFQQKG